MYGKLILAAMLCMHGQALPGLALPLILRPALTIVQSPMHNLVPFILVFVKEDKQLQWIHEEPVHSPVSESMMVMRSGVQASIGPFILLPLLTS